MHSNFTSFKDLLYLNSCKSKDFKIRLIRIKMDNFQLKFQNRFLIDNYNFDGEKRSFSSKSERSESGDEIEIHFFERNESF
jgi:hypothetical protein